MWPQSSRQLRALIVVWAIGSLAYVAYMFSVDVPMYCSNWIAGEASGRSYLSIAHGLRDISGRWVVSYR
jgi:hypothetical protein